MTVDQAFQLTLEEIELLKNAGIRVYMEPYNGKQKDDGELNRLRKIHWRTVSFEYMNNEQRQLLTEAKTRLNNQGIYFDTGGWNNSRDWELDWSFRYEP